MKKLFLLFLPIICFANQPKFHFNDRVKVIHGFYLGCEGNVRSYNESGDQYDTVLDCNNDIFSEWIDSKNLELVKGSK